MNTVLLVSSILVLCPRPPCRQERRHLQSYENEVAEPRRHESSTHQELQRNKSPRQRDKCRVQVGSRLLYPAVPTFFGVLSLARTTAPAISTLEFLGWQGSHPRCKPYAGQAAYACSDSQCLGSLDPHAFRSDTPVIYRQTQSGQKDPKTLKYVPFSLLETPAPFARASSFPYSPKPPGEGHSHTSPHP